MSWGRRNRRGRVLDPATGRTNMLAVDPVAPLWP